MTSKNKIKQRVLDVCAGAGAVWQEDGQYFECGSGLEDYGRVIQGCEIAFSLGNDTRIRTPWRLKDLQHVDTLTDLVMECLQYDLPS